MSWKDEIKTNPLPSGAMIVSCPDPACRSLNCLIVDHYMNVCKCTKCGRHFRLKA